YFTSPVVARADFSSKPTFAQLLSQVRQQVFAALEHQDYPFALLVEKLNPKRDPSRPPIFQANFVLQNFHHTQLHADPAAADVAVESIPIVLAEGQLDLSLEMLEGPEGLEGYLKGSADLFAQATLARMVGHWETLLHSIVAEPEQAVMRLPLLTAAERQKILVEWNQNATPYAKDQCMHQLFEAQVLANPDAPALFSEAGTLATGQAYPELSFTYGQANALANQLAHHLQSLGVGVETLVGLYVERSALLIVGLLGILKAGGAY
ncbi:MAG: condensation domain-containing protein, partial [Caldilinea sp.]